MANLKEIFNITFETAYEGLTNKDHIINNHGTVATFDDNSAIGFLDQNSQITDLLFGVFVPEVGFQLSAINLKDYESDLINIYSAWAHEHDPDHWSTIWDSSW